jgi:uncharacterized phage protein (TIGR01671 family)
MREILFRGKRADSGEWIEGNLFIPDKEDTPTEICIGTNIVRITYDVIPETVGQYTGLKDKNGEKIFEGDIVHAEICEGNYQGFRFPIGEVVFENGSFCIKDYKQTTPLSSYSPRVQFEVIGNIHENLEMLKGEQE